MVVFVARQREPLVYIFDVTVTGWLLNDHMCWGPNKNGEVEENRGRGAVKRTVW